jgi:hypothetical protein
VLGGYLILLINHRSLCVCVCVCVFFYKYFKIQELPVPVTLGKKNQNQRIANSSFFFKSKKQHFFSWKNPSKGPRLCTWVFDYFKGFGNHGYIYISKTSVLSFLRTAVMKPKNHPDNRWWSTPDFVKHPIMGLDSCKQPTLRLMIKLL